jgi:hypothetical protein
MNSKSILLVGLCCVAQSIVVIPARADEKFQLPPEITPAVRAACEQNVRQICVTPTSTQDSIVSCVRRNFISLNKRCRSELASAGLM